MGAGGAKGKVAGRWWLSRQPVKGRGESKRLASLGAFQATELAGSSLPPVMAEHAGTPPGTAAGYRGLVASSKHGTATKVGRRSDLLRAEEQHHATRTSTTTTTCRISTEPDTSFSLRRGHIPVRQAGGRGGGSQRGQVASRNTERGAREARSALA